MLIEKSIIGRVRELAEKGVDVIIAETPTYMYKDEESAREQRLAILSAPSYAYKHPCRERLLNIYEVFTSKKELAKKIKKAFKWQSIGKPLTIREHFARCWDKIWEKIRRKLDLGGGFGRIKIYNDFFCLYTVAEDKEVERKLANL